LEVFLPIRCPIPKNPGFFDVIAEVEGEGRKAGIEGISLEPHREDEDQATVVC